MGRPVLKRFWPQGDAGNDGIIQDSTVEVLLVERLGPAGCIEAGPAMTTDPFRPAPAFAKLTRDIELERERRPPVITLVEARVVAGVPLEVEFAEIRVRRGGARQELIGVDAQLVIAAARLATGV